MTPRRFAIAAVLVMLAAPLAGVCWADEEETDAAAPIAIAIVASPEAVEAMTSIVTWMLVGAGIGAGAGIAIGWTAHEMLNPDEDLARRYSRLMAADKLAESVATAAAFTASAEASYDQIWKLSKEHWVRQAELEAYAEWTANGHGFRADDVLTGSMLLRNAAVMNANAVAQLNLFLEQTSAEMAELQTKEAYRDKIQAGFFLDGIAARQTSSGDLGAMMLSVADARSSAQRVYIGLAKEGDLAGLDYSPSYVYSDGDATITGNGTSFALSKGVTDLSSLRTSGGASFQPGIYRVSQGSLIAGDTLAQLPGEARLMPGMALRDGSGWGLAYLDDSGKVRMDSAARSKLTFRASASDLPQGESQPPEADLTPMLERYGGLLDSMRWTATAALSSARAVWDVYDACAAKSHTVTTLMNTVNYDGMALSSGMKEAMTLSAMQQLVEYARENGDDLDDLYVGLYRGGEAFDTAFVLGDVYDRSGSLLYKDAVYTPFFQQRSATLRAGTDLDTDQSALLMVWGTAEEGETLAQWWARANEEGTLHYQCPFLDRGARLAVRELAECDDEGIHEKAEVTLEVTQVNFIDPTKIKKAASPDPPEETTNWLTVALVVCGALLLVYGLARRDWLFFAVGAALLAFGAAFGTPMWDWITGLRPRGRLFRGRRQAFCPEIALENGHIRGGNGTGRGSGYRAGGGWGMERPVPTGRLREGELAHAGPHRGDSGGGAGLQARPLLPRDAMAGGRPGHRLGGGARMIIEYPHGVGRSGSWWYTYTYANGIRATQSEYQGDLVDLEELGRRLSAEKGREVRMRSHNGSTDRLHAIFDCGRKRRFRRPENVFENKEDQGWDSGERTAPAAGGGARERSPWSPSPRASSPRGATRRT